MKKSSRCSRCAYKAKLKAKICSFCGIEFKLANKSHRCCSEACRQLKLQAYYLSNRVDETEKRQRKRALAKRINKRRQALGWRRKQGRWIEVCERDGWVCWVCHQPIDPARTRLDRLSGTVDHVVPISAGGSDEDSNLKAAHLSCNVRRMHLGKTA